MQKIAADKVNIMECDPEGALNFFPKSNSVHYCALTIELGEKSVVLKCVYEII